MFLHSFFATQKFAARSLPNADVLIEQNHTPVGETFAARAGAIGQYMGNARRRKK